VAGVGIFTCSTQGHFSHTMNWALLWGFLLSYDVTRVRKLETHKAQGIPSSLSELLRGALG
jgi:hypothetical protein